MNNNKVRTAQKMLEIALEYIDTYKSDIVFDYSAIFEDVNYNGSYLWAIRPTGTYLAPINENLHDTMCYASITGGYSKRFFILDIANGTATEITKDEALNC